MAKVGICSLTGDNSVFVRSHILPKALTKLSDNGERYLEKSLNSRSVWRSNSWYDYSLVTRKGEDILSEIDTNGIKVLRENMLVWSGWKKRWSALPSEYFLQRTMQYNGGLLRFRRLDSLDTSAIRQFYLSILWRAASSSRHEMKDIKINDEKLEIIKRIILDKTLDKNHIFPMDLDQIVTRGIHHNRTPIYENLAFKYNDEEVTFGCFRIYFDGLVCRIYDSIEDDNVFSDLSEMLIQDNRVTLICRNFEHSRSCENLSDVINS